MPLGIFSFFKFQVGNKTYKVNVKELPSFHKGMCYLIENMSNHTSNDWITVTFKKKEDIDIKFIQVTMTSKHDYLGVTHSFWGDFMPYRFIVYFGDILIPKITAVETIKKPLDCQTSDSEYISEQECLVNHFLSDNFSTCPVKCIPIQMRGFRYVNNSSNLKNCVKIEDEVCNGGPPAWNEIAKRFSNCMKPCKVSSYTNSLLDKKIMTYNENTKKEATYEFIFSKTRQEPNSVCPISI